MNVFFPDCIYKSFNNELRFDSKKWNKPTFALVSSVAVVALLVTFRFVSSCCKEFASDRC